MIKKVWLLPLENWHKYNALVPNAAGWTLGYWNVLTSYETLAETKEGSQSMVSSCSPQLCHFAIEVIAGRPLHSRPQCFCDGELEALPCPPPSVKFKEKTRSCYDNYKVQCYCKVQNYPAHWDMWVLINTYCIGLWKYKSRMFPMPLRLTF